MNIDELQQKIMTDDAYVERELQKLALYYKLKHTIRWNHSRQQNETESVAEHVYGMNVLTSYFLPLIDPAHELDRELIHELILWHDMAEALVDDVPTQTKTDAHRQAERDAEAQLTAGASEHLREHVREIFTIYENQDRPEARFVKAIDKVEPMLHLYFLAQHETDLKPYFDLGWSAETYQEYRQRYIHEFPLLVRFDDVLHATTKAFHPNV